MPYPSPTPDLCAPSCETFCQHLSLYLTLPPSRLDTHYYKKKQKDSLGWKIKASYLLLDGFNDSDKHIEELIKILDRDVFKVQILLYNENEKLPFKRPSIEKARSFEKKLNENGLETKISISKGQDIAGACGQMAGKKKIKEIVDER